LHNNDASWIATNLDVALRPNKNLADVTLSSEDIPARELQLIVDGIIDAYEREIVLATLNLRTSE
jgi:hypothetical protein